MKAYVFGVIMNFVAAVALLFAGASEMNNLGTSIPAILCLTAGVLGVIQIRNRTKK